MRFDFSEIDIDKIRNATAQAPSFRFNPNMSPDEQMAAIIKDTQQNYEDNYIPVEDAAIDSLDDMSIVNQAAGNVEKGFRGVLGRNARERRRYGVAKAGGAEQQQVFDRNFQLAQETADSVNNARLNQFDRNRGFRNELINVGRGVVEQATSGMTEAARADTARQNVNDSSEAAWKAQNTQLAGTLGAAALFAFMM